MSTWTRTIALAVTAFWLAGCSSVSQRQLAQDALTAMGGADKVMAIQTLSMTGGKGTRTKVGQPMTADGKDQVGQLANDVEVLDLANGRAYSDYEITVGTFMQHRHEVLTKTEGAGGKPVGIESIDGVTFATTPGGLFSWGTQNSPEWMLKRNPVSIVLGAAESASAADAAQEESFDGKMMKHAHAKTHEGEDVGLYFDPETKLLAGFEVLDTEPMLGDVTAQYMLSDYKEVNGVKLPHHIKIRKGAEDFSDIQYTSIAINDAKAAEAFAIPQAKGIPAQAAQAATLPDSFPMKLEKVANGVYQAQAFRHHSMVVEFPTYVAVVEAPYLETQTRMLAQAVARQFPDKPIKYVAVTHFHYDHIGGVRAAAALGATILIEKRHESALKKVLDAKHTHPRDDLETARTTKKAVGTIEIYEGQKIIKDGNQSLELHAFMSSHAEPMVMAYVPSARALFQSDLWFPKTGAPASPETVELANAIKSANLKVDTMVGGHGLFGPFAEMTKAIAAMKK
jgi:glyoxylase-like metal-dependent hydrolase (beta-lactamase superfamily II)